MVKWIIPQRWLEGGGGKTGQGACIQLRPILEDWIDKGEGHFEKGHFENDI